MGGSAGLRAGLVGSKMKLLVGKGVTPCDDTEDMETDHDQVSYTRGVVFTLDPTPAQECLLRSYCGAG